VRGDQTKKCWSQKNQERERGKTSKVLEPKKEEKRGRERRSKKELLEPKKIRNSKGREEAKSIVAKKRGNSA
jgi:hypothetical protein